MTPVQNPCGEPGALEILGSNPSGPIVCDWQTMFDGMKMDITGSTHTVLDTKSDNNLMPRSMQLTIGFSMQLFSTFFKLLNS